MFALGIQIAATGLGLGATVTMVVNGFIEFRFGLFHRMLAL